MYDILSLWRVPSASEVVVKSSTTVVFFCRKSLLPLMSDAAMPTYHLLAPPRQPMVASVFHVPMVLPDRCAAPLTPFVWLC